MTATRWAALVAAAMMPGGCGSSPPGNAFDACRAEIRELEGDAAGFSAENSSSERGDGGTWLITETAEVDDFAGGYEATYVCEVSQVGNVTDLAETGVEFL